MCSFSKAVCEYLCLLRTIQSFSKYRVLEISPRRTVQLPCLWSTLVGVFGLAAVQEYAGTVVESIQYEPECQL
jgi:hypothetical protein